MAHLQTLPERLQYLQPFRKKFASRQEELAEESDITPLLELLRKRIKGLSDEKAEAILQEDIVVLEKWLALPEQINDCLHFAAGVFLIASPADLIKQIRKDSEEQKKPLPWVEMDLWPKVKPRRFEKQRDGGMLVRWKGLLFTVGVVSDEEAARKERPGEFWNQKNEVTSSSVRFGQVTGLKYVEVSKREIPLPEKQIISERSIVYILTVPGGHVRVSLSCLGRLINNKWNEQQRIEWCQEQVRTQASWDERPVEAFFHTLRIVLKQPSGN